jgi:uncharacterized protein YecT (DUF1311 family)
MGAVSRSLVLVAALLWPGIGAAQERDEDECLRLNPSISSPVEMATCTSDLAGSEAALTSALANLRDQVPIEHRVALDKAQQAWLAHRRAQCEWEAGGYPGNTGHSASIIGCTADLNRERARYLERDRQARW